MTSVVVEGPAWAPHNLDLRAGRFPLGVEAHLMQMTAHLVPGITTVTTNARYFALHGYVSLVANERQHDWESTIQLLRRCEVVVAAATIAHPGAESIHTAHGNDVIKPLIESGSVNLDELSSPGGYSRNRSGFLNAYLGGEIEMGILADTALTPGPRADRHVLYAGFDGLADLAEQPTLTLAELEDASHLSIHGAASSRDGKWLAELFCSDGLDDARATDLTRRNTIRLLARALELTHASTADAAFYAAIGYGAMLRSDPVLCTIEESQPWRGTLLRRHSVNAWRRMWAWLVDQIGEGLSAIDGHTAPSELADAAIAQCPGGTVRQYLAELPNPVDNVGDPAPAEAVIAGQQRSEFDQALATLAIGGQRLDTLEGSALTAFAGRRSSILDPAWMRNELDEALERPMPDFVNGLVHDVLDRSQRIAAKRSRLQRDGTYVVPGRVHEHAGRLWRTSTEGRGNVGLRLEQLARNLTAVGVLERDNGTIQLTAYGKTLIDNG